MEEEEDEEEDEEEEEDDDDIVAFQLREKDGALTKTKEIDFWIGDKDLVGWSRKESCFCGKVKIVKN